VESAPESLTAGQGVHFYTHHKNFLGTGFYNSRSLIAGRLLDRHRVAVDLAFIENRLRRALELRRVVCGGDAYRWVFGESDDLPGLIIDRYGDACVIESTCAGMDVLMPTILKAVQLIHPWKTVVLRNDAPSRRLEGLSEEVRVVVGSAEVPQIFECDGFRLSADLTKGQKTGFFFDQRDNRRAVAALSSGRRVADVFCHTGGFGLWAARAGAAQVVGVDESSSALDMARMAADANGFKDRMTFEKADGFEWLAASKETFDIVVLDPPKFSPTKKDLPKAREAYIRLNALALKRVVSGGFLATSTCSQHVDREEFRQILSRASYHAGRRTKILQWGGQSPDHPIRPSMPETEYLKFALLHVL
jgi:23S rRNA (cytosine1962-C5)-methyltransferase